MSRSLRWLTCGVVALLIVSSILLAASGVPVPSVATGSVRDTMTQVSSAIYVVTLLSLAVEWSLVLTAAQFMPLWVRLLLLLLLLLAPVIALLASGPLIRHS